MEDQADLGGLVQVFVKGVWLGVSLGALRVGRLVGVVKAPSSLLPEGTGLAALWDPRLHFSTELFTECPCVPCVALLSPWGLFFPNPESLLILFFGFFILQIKKF